MQVANASGVVPELRNSILSTETREQANQGISWIYDYQGPTPYLPAPGVN